MRVLFIFLCKKYARIIKARSLVKKITFKGQVGINPMSKKAMIFTLLQVTLSNLKMSARRYQTLDHLFPPRP